MAHAEQMRVAQIDRFSGPEVLNIVETPKASPGGYDSHRWSFQRTTGSASARSRAAILDTKIDLEAVVSDHYAAVYRFAYSLTKNESDAADLTQETFLILASHYKQVREPESLKCWLFTTLRRQFLRRWRSRAWHPEVPFCANEQDTPTEEQSALRKTDAKLALEALAKVDESYRSALELFYLGDLSYKEISAVLGVPIGTVMSRLSRGKALLRQRLAAPAIGTDTNSKITHLQGQLDSGSRALCPMKKQN
jgi:RNA polymerase sigma-70 factor, ECF subfamily